VDFVYKQRADNDKKWALRNAKLRMSRKLIFAAGLAIVFLCHLDGDADESLTLLRKKKDVSLLTAYIERQTVLTPLEIIAKVCLNLEIGQETTRAIFDSYDQFLAILDDSSKWSELETGRSQDELRNSEVWGEIRQLSRAFHEGLVALFLKEDSRLQSLAMTYGVF
jgi:hypothetical protein